MAFTLKAHEQVGHAFHRLGEKQLRKAHDDLLDADDALDAVHGVRKAAKRVRALLRVMRPGLEPKRYRQINTLVRDAAAVLSSGRDAQALVGTFDALILWSPEGFVGQSTARAELARRAQAGREAFAGDPELIKAAAHDLEAARRQIHRTSISGNRRVLRAGFHDTYRTARRAQRSCENAAHDDDTIWHEWRKGTKYLWHAVQLVEPSSPSLLHGGEKQLHRLADALGDDHDLTVLGALVRERPWAFGNEHERTVLHELIASARVDLHTRALDAGARFFVERPDAFADRHVGSWTSWSGDDELPLGGLEDLAEEA